MRLSRPLPPDGATRSRPGQRRRRIAASATVLALVAAVSLNVDAVALTWGTTRTLTTTRNAVADHGLAVTTGNVFHAVFAEARGGVLAIRYRRSTDKGVTWSPSVVLSSPAASYVYGAAITARGTYLDAAWIEQQGTALGLIYRRSTNAGVSWGAPVNLVGTFVAAPAPGAPADGGAASVPVVDETAVSEASSGAAGPRATAGELAGPPGPDGGGRQTADTIPNPSPSYPRLVRDSSNRVIVTWTDDGTGAMYVRRSTDGGVTWLAAQAIDTTTNQPVSSGPYFDAYPDIAAGTGILYLAYYRSATSLRVRRSTNGGASWTTSATIASNGSGYAPSVTATGSSAVVGYAVWASPHLYTVIRRTSDKGATWKTVVKLGASTGAFTFQPIVVYGGGRWQAIFERCLDTSCNTSAVYHRSSSDGVTWTTAARVSSRPRPYQSPGGLAYADRLGVLFYDWAPAVLDSDVFFRAGS